MGVALVNSPGDISLILFIRVHRYLVSSVDNIAAAPLDRTLFCLGSIQDRDATPIPPKISFWVYRMQEAKS